MKHLIVAGAVVLAIVLGVLGLIFLNVTKVDESVDSYGSASSPSVVNGCMEINGLTECRYGTRMVTNASTTCAFRSPSATSTLVRAAATVTNLYGGTFDLEFGKAATIMATTTSLGIVTSAVLNSTIVASSTPVNGGELLTQIFPPNYWLNVKVGSSSPTIAGYCSAVFQTL